MSPAGTALRLLRHATLVLRIGGAEILVDPMLADAGSTPPIDNTEPNERNPLVELPPVDLSSIDAVVVTHTHRDHFDDAATERLPSSVPVFCQPDDEAAIEAAGFTNVRPVADSAEWRGVSIARTGGRHGHDDLAEAMGPVSGFVFSTADEPTVFVAGDTVWCPTLADALDEHAPDVVVLNAGGARFVEGEPITMTDADVDEVCGAVPDATIIAVHLDAINHCLQSREALRDALEERAIEDRVTIPADGEWVPLL